MATLRGQEKAIAVLQRTPTSKVWKTDEQLPDFTISPGLDLIKSCLPSKCVSGNWNPHNASVRLRVCSTKRSSPFLLNFAFSFNCNTNTISPVVVSGCTRQERNAYRSVTDWCDIALLWSSCTTYLVARKNRHLQQCHLQLTISNHLEVNAIDYNIHTASSASPVNVIFWPCCIPFSTWTSSSFLSCTTFCPLHCPHLSFSLMVSPAERRNTSYTYNPKTANLAETLETKFEFPN